MPITVRTLCWAKTRSTATTSGRWSSTQASIVRLEGEQAIGDVGVGRRAYVSDRDHVQRTSRIALDHAQTAAGQTGVNPEHAHDRSSRDEHLFGTVVAGPDLRAPTRRARLSPGSLQSSQHARHTDIHGAPAGVLRGPDLADDGLDQSPVTDSLGVECRLRCPEVSRPR